jgi:hypothetical protein
MVTVALPPDYTAQLDKIAEILGRRQTPQWVWLVVGWLLGIASTVVVGWIKGISDRRNVRRMLYREMARNYWQLKLLRDKIMRSSPDERLINAGPTDVLEFGAFEHAKSRRDVFESLGEVADIETVYERFRRSESLSVDRKRTVFDLNPVLAAFARRVGNGFSKRTLLAVSTPPVRESIVRIAQDRDSAHEPE